MRNIRQFEQVIGVIALGLLLIGCFAVMRQFISALLWSAVLCFCLWPVHRRLLVRVGNRRNFAAILTTLVLVLFLVLPFVTIAVTLSGDVGDLARATYKWIDSGPPDPPSWLESIPAVGDRAKAMWQEFADDRAKLGQMMKKVIQPASAWLLSAGLGIGRGVVEVGLSVFLAFFLFRDGAALTNHLTAGLGRVAGERGRHMLEVAGSTVRGVFYGILGTGIVQGIMAAVGFLIAGVPGATLLGLLTFFLSVVPAGPTLVWLPVTIWLFQQGSTGWAIFMLVWGMGVSSVDNVLRPWFISQGSNLPFVLIFFGVVGGALAFGFIGVFLGPTLLAVAYRLVEEWLAMTASITSEVTSPGRPPGPINSAD